MHLHEFGAARRYSGTATKEIKSNSSEISTGSAQNSCSGEQPMSVACSMNEPHLPIGGSELKYHHLMTLKDFTYKHHHRLAFRGMYFSFFKHIKLDCPTVHRIVRVVMPSLSSSLFLFFFRYVCVEMRGILLVSILVYCNLRKSFI